MSHTKIFERKQMPVLEWYGAKYFVRRVSIIQRFHNPQDTDYVVYFYLDEGCKFKVAISMVEWRVKHILPDELSTKIGIYSDYAVPRYNNTAYILEFHHDHIDFDRPVEYDYDEVMCARRLCSHSLDVLAENEPWRYVRKYLLRVDHLHREICDLRFLPMPCDYK